jgi:hypothetical protein
MGYIRCTATLIFLYLFITLKTIDITNSSKQPKQSKHPHLLKANMQFSQVFFVAAIIASATAAPTGDLEARTSGGIQCQKHEGKWKYGWEGAAPSEKYTCATGGLIVGAQSSSSHKSATSTIRTDTVLLRTS